MNDGQENVDEHARTEQPVDEAEHAAQPPAVLANGAKDHVVGKGEPDSEDEMKDVAERLCPHPVLGERRAEEKRDVDARDP